MNTYGISTQYDDYVVEAEGMVEALDTIRPDFMDDEVVTAIYIIVAS